MRAWVAMVLTWLLFAAPALAENKLALVVGNDGYQNIAPLEKARADGAAYAAALREKGFVVEEGYDLTYARMNAAISTFVSGIQPGDTAVFVYSGHGWSDGTQNYLVSIDAPASASEDELAGVTTPVRNGVTGVLDRIERRGAGLRVAIIDACRDNPFRPPAGQRAYSFARGLAPMAQPPEGTFVVFSASAGQSALDRLGVGDGDPNSVFTRVFVPLLRDNISLQDAVKGAQGKVLTLARAADHDQRPSYWDEVVGPACLSTQCNPAYAPQSPPATSASDQALAALIEIETNVQALTALIAKLPEGTLKERAKARAEALKKQQAASVAPEPARPSPSPAASASDDAVAAMIDAATTTDQLAALIAKLPEGALRERAKARADALKGSQIANLAPEPSKPSSLAPPVSSSPLGPTILGGLILPKSPAAGDKPYTAECGASSCSAGFLRRSVSLNGGGMREVDIVDWRWDVDQKRAPTNSAPRERVRKNVVVACENSDLAVFYSDSDEVKIASDGTKPATGQIETYDLWWAACRNAIGKFSKIR